jgi:hypothetical protein
MLDLYCPAPGYRCGYSGNFLVCSIQVHNQLASNWRGLKWPGQREVALVEEVGRGGRRTEQLIVKLLAKTVGEFELQQFCSVNRS